MKTNSAGPLHSFTAPLVSAAVQLDLFTRLLFMSRRKKIRYLSRTIFQQIRPRY
jgi:hypothetical protein